ncbi:MAG: hypothetical protein DHS20C12_26890 [Pseudohongiella sp.]|nr:MAG: hypothetical protein DHS20C12_26890 [Pseudohongiella sp.]
MDVLRNHSAGLRLVFCSSLQFLLSDTAVAADAVYVWADAEPGGDGRPFPAAGQPGEPSLATDPRP